MIVAQACKFLSIALLHPAVFSAHSAEDVYRAVEGVLHSQVKEAEASAHRLSLSLEVSSTCRH